MMQFLQTLKSFFSPRSGDQPRLTDVDELARKAFSRVRAGDSDTNRQWLRLQQAIDQSEASSVRHRSTAVPRFAFVSAIAIVAALGVFVYFTYTGSIKTIVTGRGEQKELVLDDGSQVILSHTTEINTTRLQAGRERMVSLTGEAYFRVRQGETPFIVSTKYADVNVVGTEFNVRAREAKLEVAVISGIVRVNAQRDQKDSTLTLTQSQMAIVSQGDFPKRLGNIPSREYPAWMYGKLFLNGTSLEEACREIELRFDVSIKFGEKNIQRDLITGILDARTVESALAALCEVSGKKYHYDGQAYRIY